MTTDRDFDVIARAWLDLMPDEAPDRTVAAILQAVETTPQVRRPIRGLTWRSPTMNRLPIALGAAAVVVVAGTLLLSRAGAPPTVGASASLPSTAASSASTIPPSGTTADAPLPIQLLGRWMGDHRQVVPSADAGASILFGRNTVAISQSNSNTDELIGSAAADIGSGRIRLTSSITADGCTAGDMGTYGWARSASGRTLTITTESDDCAARSEAVAGVWWLMGCTNPTDDCLGALDAGTYKSQYIAPRLKPGATWTANFGALSYSVPDGWANSADWPQTFDLVPQAELAMAETDKTRKIGLVTQPLAMAQDQPCSDTAAPGVGRGVDALVTWMRTVPGLVTSKPTTMTIGGHPAKWLDLQVDAGWKRSCPGETKPIIAFLNPGTAISGLERERLYVVDLGDGDVMAIVVWTADPVTFDAFVPEATPIIGSFLFE
jgi:hypothetical protein